MRILLDTHLALWAVTADPQLGAMAQSMLLDTNSQVFVSAATIWEVAIKHRKHPLVMPMAPQVLIDACIESGFQLLAISAQHAHATALLPLLHTDPFDRLLIAQALHEPLVLLTRDAQVARYSPLIKLV